MFERFTDRAGRVVVLAQEEARLLDHDHIGTGHILLGLIHEGEGVAADSLRSLGIRLDPVRDQVVEKIALGRRLPRGHIPFTRRAKKVLEYSLREALQLGHDHVETEHVLLGLVREGDGVATQVLEKLGADLSKVRSTVITLLSGGSGDEADPIGTETSYRFSQTTDSITLTGLSIQARHGVTEQERAVAQTFVVDVTAFLDLAAAGRTDELSATVDYGVLAEAIYLLVADEQWQLIERVAERVAELVLADRRVVQVEVTVHKPDAPIPVEFGDVSVTIVRTAPNL